MEKNCFKRAKAYAARIVDAAEYKKVCQEFEEQAGGSHRAIGGTQKDAAERLRKWCEQQEAMEELGIEEGIDFLSADKAEEFFRKEDDREWIHENRKALRLYDEARASAISSADVLADDAFAGRATQSILDKMKSLALSKWQSVGERGIETIPGREVLFLPYHTRCYDSPEERELAEKTLKILCGADFDVKRCKKDGKLALRMEGEILGIAFRSAGMIFSPGANRGD